MRSRYHQRLGGGDGVGARLEPSGTTEWSVGAASGCPPLPEWELPAPSTTAPILESWRTRSWISGSRATLVHHRRPIGQGGCKEQVLGSADAGEVKSYLGAEQPPVDPGGQHPVL